MASKYSMILSYLQPKVTFLTIISAETGFEYLFPNTVPYIVTNDHDRTMLIPTHSAGSSSRVLASDLPNAKHPFIWMTKSSDFVFCGGLKIDASSPNTECSRYQLGASWTSLALTTSLPNHFYEGAHLDLGNGRQWIGGGRWGGVYVMEHVLINGERHKGLQPPMPEALVHFCAARLPDYKVWSSIQFYHLW